ncbi:TolC family protein [Mitsuaria sp. WAJ17]|uniref:TolC family protein n=1 Tax=Mitsuaria sp. WAJ17 TaxID=2761452 RepID=UPI0015FFA8E2|nr:TolC family protein [Mitsuaria sp. WAJ17]MBB2484370.1 TolC family protein [Mitsuaria sp. WAJ17]
MRAFVGPLGLAAAFLSPVPSLAQNSLTLDQALEQAATRSPLIAAAVREVDAARGASLQAGLWRNPELSATVEDLRRDSRTTTITLDIPLELGGKRSARVGAAERTLGLALAELSKVRADVRADVIQAFFGALLAQERVQLAQGSADIAGRAADAVALRVAAGKVSPLEASRAHVDRANAQLELAESRAGLQTARAALAAVLGDAAPAFEGVQGDLAVLPHRPALDELLARLDASPALLAGRLEAERRRALVDVERSRAVPDLVLNLGSRRDAAAGRTQAIVGFTLPLPVFDRNQGAVVEASRRAEKADDELQALRLRLLTELQDASQRLAQARHSLAILQEAVLPSARQAHEAASKGFDAGKFGFLDVVDAQRTLLLARARYLNTLAAAHQAVAAIDRITGR